MPEQGQISHTPSSRLRGPLWIIAVLLAFIAGLLWNRGGGADWLPSAMAQQAPMAGARGVYAFTGQIDASRYGLFMLDIEQGTIWCYEMESGGGKRMLKLTAARTWIYDRYLRDFNCAEPNFRQVQELIARQRANPSPDADAGRPGDSGKDGGAGRVLDSVREKKPKADGSPGEQE